MPRIWRITSLARRASALISVRRSRISCRSILPRSMKRCPARALLAIPASGWFSSWAIDADISPINATRVRWLSSSRRCLASVSASFRAVISMLIPRTRAGLPSLSKCTLPRVAIQRTIPSGKTSRYSESKSFPSSIAQSIISRIRFRSLGCTWEIKSSNVTFPEAGHPKRARRALVAQTSSLPRSHSQIPKLAASAARRIRSSLSRKAASLLISSVTSTHEPMYPANFPCAL